MCTCAFWGGGVILLCGKQLEEGSSIREAEFRAHGGLKATPNVRAPWC